MNLKLTFLKLFVTNFFFKPIMLYGSKSDSFIRDIMYYESIDYIT
ncbi:hypothetical protein [Flavivirga spongiicola]|uniref:Uncharacterized protein n=1 Tax=Flavivirga spongiicola TaxID=421621 RepID=A0ABU7XX89_9FLAO|nr:hypothetical protein [Flavivirga sp. MEBiC05379]MDO5980158.1 hypothetical protein [Flavivirga sp. MEBiC05379]